MTIGQADPAAYRRNVNTASWDIQLLHPESLDSISKMLASIHLPQAIASGVFLGEIIAPLMVILGILFASRRAAHLWEYGVRAYTGAPCTVIHPDGKRWLGIGVARILLIFRSCGIISRQRPSGAKAGLRNTRNDDEK